MAIPVYLQQFKAAGIYRVVFDKSTVLNVNSEILRLVVGYSEKGPFNIPVYIKNATDFKTYFGDISTKLEKRGVWFHRLALQALAAGPILALNLKKFNTENVGAVTIDTTFNPKYVDTIIDPEDLYVKDIYNTERFWELDAEKLNGLRTKDGSVMDKYINISATDVSATGTTFFIRKAVGNQINNYKVSLSDWYADGLDVMPEYLESQASSFVSDFMAEVYVFKGQFNKEQVLASTTLKNHFTTNDKGELKLRPYELDAFGEPMDSLEALYRDENSGAIGHYVGSLIPYMKNKKGQYISLNIVFNDDQDVHKMMMSFNTDMLEDDENPVNINISGKRNINTTEETDLETEPNVKNIFNGTAKVSVLGNKYAEVNAQIINYRNNVETLKSGYDFNKNETSISGVSYISFAEHEGNTYSVTLTDCHNSYTNVVKMDSVSYTKFSSVFSGTELTYSTSAKDYNNKTVVTSLKNMTAYYNGDTISYYTFDSTNKGSKLTTSNLVTELTPKSAAGHVGCTHIYSSSVSFIEIGSGWSVSSNTAYTTVNDDTLTSAIAVGEVFIAESTIAPGVCGLSFVTKVETVEEITTPADTDEVLLTKAVAKYNGKTASESGLNTIQLNSTLDEFVILHTSDTTSQFEFNTTEASEDDKAKLVEIYKTFNTYNANDVTTTKTVISFTENPYQYGTTEKYLVRLDNDICQENGEINPVYLHGYEFENAKPAGTDMLSKLNWQNNVMLAALTDYKGLRTGLLNKSDIDYRYVVDTFETFVTSGAKKVLSYLCKEKQSAFAIVNFPAVKTFVKCPYASFTDTNNVFNVQYVVDGYNKKKSHSMGFSLPSDDEGASFCAFYTPLKFSDGYVDSVVPSAALVSNLFMQKYMSRKPYYIIAGPNYGAISASGMVGPDYNYSMDELQIIEPFGVNCMVYRPNFGTFINANQTAKQTPVSALSKVNVRELVIYLQDEIEKVLQAYQWEFNNATTRNAILERANSICTNIQANGGIQAFKNVMDESNNGPEIIDNEMAVLSTHIEPGMGCGKMVQELTLYRTGQMSSSISD